MKKYILAVLIAIIALSSTSCREDIPQLNRPEDWLFTGGYADEFEMYWSAMNHNYVFWDVDPTDWDEVHRIYKAKFEALDQDKESTEEEIHAKSFELYKELTSTLVDGHYTLVFNDYTAIIPSKKQKKADATPVLWKEYTDEFLTICDEQLKEPVFFGLQGKDGEIEFLAVSGLIEVNGGTVPYFFFSEFSLLQYLSMYDNMALLFDNYLENIARPDVKGVIIDVRGNGGGDTRDLGLVLGNLSNREFTMAYTRSKAGEGRLDYTPWTPYQIKPMEDAVNITAPVVVLADVNSVSCAEFTTMGVKALPNGNGVFLGKTTHGGQGGLTMNARYNGGQFTTATIFNGLDLRSQYILWVYTSSEMTKTAFDGKIYEGKGLTPDIDVNLDINKYMNGSDTQLEQAISYIKGTK